MSFLGCLKKSNNSLIMSATLLLMMILLISFSLFVTTSAFGLDIISSSTQENSRMTSMGMLHQASLEQQQQTASPSINNSPNSYESIPTAESVYKTESMALPTSVGSFVILVVNEAHESWEDERHKLITDKNSYYIPKNLIIPQETNIAFLNSDAPWDTPHPQTIEVTDSKDENAVYNTGTMNYTNSSQPTVLPVGNYTIVNTQYEATEGTISVTNQKKSNGNLVVGGIHPGSLDYYRKEFPRNGFRILSEYNFTYATCDYCPGGYWPDNKTGEHTLIIFATEQPLPEALIKLKKLVKDNVYV
jgi:hypothetical protein